MFEDQIPADALPAADATFSPEQGFQAPDLFQPPATQEQAWDFSALADLSDPAQTQSAQSTQADPYALLPEQDRQMLEWAKGRIGSTLYQRVQERLPQFGSEEAFLEALETPEVDQNWVEQQVQAQLAPVLDATNEYGEPRYSASDPLVQLEANRLRQQFTQQAIDHQRAQARAERARIEQVANAVRQYPYADQTAVQLAANNGINPVQYAAQLHAQNLARVEAAKRAAAQNQNLVRQATHPARQAPAPISGRPGQPAPQGIPTPPNPLTEPEKFEAYTQQLMNMINRGR